MSEKDKSALELVNERLQDDLTNKSTELSEAENQLIRVQEQLDQAEINLEQFEGKFIVESAQAAVFETFQKLIDAGLTTEILEGLVDHVDAKGSEGAVALFESLEALPAFVEDAGSIVPVQEAMDKAAGILEDLSEMGVTVENMHESFNKGLSDEDAAILDVAKAIDETYGLETVPEKLEEAEAVVESMLATEEANLRTEICEAFSIEEARIDLIMETTGCSVDKVPEFLVAAGLEITETKGKKEKMDETDGEDDDKKEPKDGDGDGKVDSDGDGEDDDKKKDKVDESLTPKFARGKQMNRATALVKGSQFIEEARQNNAMAAGETVQESRSKRVDESNNEEGGRPLLKFLVSGKKRR